MATRTIREIALKHKLCRFVPGDDGYGGEDEPYSNAIAALNELLEACCAEVCQDCADGMPIQKEPPKGWEDRPWWHVFGKQLVGCRAARLRALGGE